MHRSPACLLWYENINELGAVKGIIYPLWACLTPILLIISSCFCAFNLHFKMFYYEFQYVWSSGFAAKWLLTLHENNFHYYLTSNLSSDGNRFVYFAGKNSLNSEAGITYKCVLVDSVSSCSVHRMLQEIRKNGNFGLNHFCQKFNKAFWTGSKGDTNSLFEFI